LVLEELGAVAGLQKAGWAAKGVRHEESAQAKAGVAVDAHRA
jgi:hypothetical protein